MRLYISETGFEFSLFVICDCPFYECCHLIIASNLDLLAISHLLYTSHITLLVKEEMNFDTRNEAL